MPDTIEVEINSPTITSDISTPTLQATLGASSPIININTSGGTDDYNELINKPQINDITLQGNKSLPDIGVEHITNSDIMYIIANY